jgi:hypothetical protein
MSRSYGTHTEGVVLDGGMNSAATKSVEPTALKQQLGIIIEPKFNTYFTPSVYQF